MIANLPMYDGPANQDANDRFWNLIRDHLGRGPEKLDRARDLLEVWRDPTMLLSQTCGLPYRSLLCDQVTLVGTPDYGVEGCLPGYYYSCIVTRATEAEDPSHYKGRKLARNDAGSQSGWAAIEQYLLDTHAGFSFVGNTVDTGSHLASARAVLDGHADIASIDAITWRFLRRDYDWTDGLRVLARTRPTPGLPLITADRFSADDLFEAVGTAIKALKPSDRETLGLKGLVRISKSDYLREPLPPS